MKHLKLADMGTFNIDIYKQLCHIWMKPPFWNCCQIPTISPYILKQYIILNGKIEIVHVHIQCEAQCTNLRIRIFSANMAALPRWRTIYQNLQISVLYSHDLLKMHQKCIYCCVLVVCIWLHIDWLTDKSKWRTIQDGVHGVSR